jgi:hypothetical protein
MFKFPLGSDKYTARLCVVIEKVMNSYQMIGKADPLEDSSGMTLGLSITPANTVPSTTILSAAAAQVQIQPINNKSDEVIARVLAILAKMDAEKKINFQKPAHYLPGGAGLAQKRLSSGEYGFDINKVQCWVCGDFGHFVDHCPGNPLLGNRPTVLCKTIPVEKLRFRQTSLGRQVVTQTPMTIVRNDQQQGRAPPLES